MVTQGQRATLAKFALLLLAFSPAVLCGIYVASFAVDVPVADDWDRAALLAKREAGALTFAELAAPTPAGDRPVLPRALTTNLYPLAGGNLLVEVALTFLTLCVVAACLHGLVRHTLASTTARIVTTLAINLALFSPLAYENLLWASRLGAVMPLAFLSIALVGVCSPLHPAIRTALCGIAAVAGSLCSLFGLGIWPAVFLAAWCGSGGLVGRAKLGFLSAIAALFAVVCLLYFRGSGITFGGTLNAVFAQLGSPLARFFTADLREASPIIGRVLLVVFAAALGVLGWRWQIETTRKALSLWLALGAFAVTAAALSAFVSGLHPIDAAQSRYISTAMLLPISLIGAGAVLLTRWANPHRDSQVSPIARLSTCAALGGLALAISWPGWVHGSRKMEQWKSARLQARASLVYWRHHGLEHPDRIDPDPIRLAKALPYLHSKGWINPAPLEAFDFGDFQLDPKRMAPSDFKEAMMREVSFEDGMLFARGHAALPGTLRSAHGIIIAWRRDKRDPWKPVAFAEPRGQSVAERIFADTNYGMGPNLSRPKQFSKWLVKKPWPDAPTGRFELGGWMLDAEKMRAYPLDGSVRLGKKIKEGGASS